MIHWFNVRKNELKQLQFDESKPYHTSLVQDMDECITIKTVWFHNLLNPNCDTVLLWFNTLMTPSNTMLLWFNIWINGLI